MDNFNLDELMDLAEAYVGPMVDAIYRRLIERDFALEDPEVVMLLTALINILGHDNRGDRPTEVLLMAAYGERGVLDRPNMRVMRWRNGALSGSDLANEPGLGSSRTYQPGEMPMPSKPKPGLTRMHQEMNSEATSSGSPLRVAVPPKGARVTQKVQTNQTIQDLDEMNDQLRSTKKELDDMTKTMLAMEEDRDMWRKLFEDCNKKQGQEIERLRQEYKERSEQVALTTSIEKVIPARDIPRGQSPMELLTPREMSQTTETRLPAETNRVTIPDPSDTLGDPVVEQTVRKLIETAGRLVADKNAPGSGVTAPYGTIDDTGRVQLSQTIIRQGISDVTPLRGSSKITERKVRKMPAKKVSRVMDVQKNNQLKYNFTGVPETDPRACFNRATWSPAVNLQQPPLGTSHLILGDSLVRMLTNLRTSWVTTVMAFGGATIAQLYRMVELMNPGRIPSVMILVGTNDISRGSDEQEAQWESMMVCLFTTLWQKFSCAVLTVCTVPMNARNLTASGRRHNEGVMRWNNIIRNLANRNAGRMILMDIEHELRAMEQARLTSDGIHFDTIEGQAWLNRVFQERLDELEAELSDTGVLKEEGTVNDTVITTFVPPNLETRLGTVPAAINYRQQSSSESGRRTDVQDRLGEAPTRRTIHPRRRIGPVNQPNEGVAGTSRSDTRSETTSSSREERPNRGSLLWSRPMPSPWHIYKEELMKLDLQKVSFIEDARRMLNGATLSVSRLYSITGVDWLIAASINFSSTTALRFADLEGLPSNNTMGPVNARPLQDVRLNHEERNREERPGRFLTARAPIGQHVKIFKQLTTPPSHVKERVYPKQVNQDGDAQRYGGLTAIKKDESIFAAYDKAEMRKAKIMVVANSEFVYTSKSLFWPDVIMLAAVDLDLLQSVSLAIGVQRQTEMNPITIVFAGINDHLHSRGFLSRLRDPATAENAVWPAIKDILESMGEVVDATKEGTFNKVALRVVFALSPGYAYLPDGLKFVYAMVALLSEGKYDVIISAPNRMIEMENLRQQHEENKRDCRTIVQQLVSSIPQEILTSTSYGRKEQGSSKRKKTVTFVDREKEGEEVEQNLLQDYLSGEKDEEKNQQSQDQHPGQVNLSGESEIDEKIPDEKQDLENKVLSGEFRWMRRKYGHDLEERAVSGTTPSTDDKSESSRMNTHSDRDSTSGSELSELAIHTLLVETRARNLDREVYQDPDSDRYLIPSERVFDNAADDLETIAVSKRSISLLPQKEVVRTDLQPFQQETQPLAKIWCVKMEEDTHQPNELNSQMRIMKTYLKARYRLSDLLRAQRNDRMTSNLKRWIENGAPDKGDLEEDSYRILRQYFMQKEGRLYLNKDGIVACRRREEYKVLYKYNAIVLPQLYQTELLFRSHDQMGHQGIDKVYQRILKRFEWPGMKKACEKWVTACLSCQQVKDPRKLRFPLQSIESSEFNEVVQIDHQKICMTDSGYNQVLVMIDHFTKYAEAVPCITASAEETCDHLINTWIARHGCPMTFQSDNGTAFVGELTKELMRRSQVAQAHSTTYHPQTNGLVERQNRTLVSMLRVYCSRYMTDWDRYLPQVMGAYNSTQHSTTGVSPHMMLTGHEKSLPLTFFYPEYEGKKTSPQVYVRDVIRRQQELNDLCRRNTQQAQARQRKRFDKKAAGAKAYSVGDYVWVFQNVIPPKGTKKLLKKWRGPFMITEVHQEGRFYRLSTGRAAHYENIKPHNPSTEDWCIPADMEEGDYLMMDPACEVNEKGTREKNDGNEVVEEGTDTPLDLDPNEQIEADDETLPYAEEDWQDSEQTEVPKNMEPDLPFTMQTRQKDGTRLRKKYNPYGDDFVVDRIDLKKIVEEVVGLEEITVSQDIDIVDDHNDEWVDDWSKPEVEFDDEQRQSNEQDLTNLRVLEWLNEMTSDPEKTSVTIQDVDRESAKYIKTERDDPSWAAQEGQLLIPASNLNLIPGMRSTGTPMDIFVRGVGVGLTHTENLIIKKLRIARETGNLEAETGEEPKKPDIGRVVESYFNLPNEYSSNIILTDSDFILTNRTCAVAITADMSFRTALAADFKREYKNVEFLWKQRPGIGGVAALPPAVSQLPGKYLCFLVTRATEKQHVDPENLVLSLTRLRDFLVEMDVKELSLPVYDPNRGRLHPRELYALVHVIFSDTNIQVYLHKKYYLSIG